MRDILISVLLGFVLMFVFATILMLVFGLVIFANPGLGRLFERSNFVTSVFAGGYQFIMLISWIAFGYFIWKRRTKSKSSK